MHPGLIGAIVVLAVVLIALAYSIGQRRQSGATSEAIKTYAVASGALMSVFVGIVLGGVWIFWCYMTQFAASIKEPFEDYLSGARLVSPFLAVLAGVFAGRKACE
jgi:multisubunit Na+/H+ antiporter MnhB subunit